ncbi:MAG: insulinase family protein [Gammaproteobacteria bacterium]|nr:insulinase family protein [Gammaproteobacteria bacterium]
MRTKESRIKAVELFILLLVFPVLASAAPKIEHWVTDNGARAYFIETHALPMVDINVVFNAASAHEPADKQGLAMLTSDMLLEGSADLDSKAVAEGFEDRGAEVGTSSLRDMAIVSLRSLSEKEYLEPVVELLAKVIADPKFPEKNLEREKARSLQSLDHSLQQPATVAKRRLYELLYGDHPYANHPSGTHESIQSIRRADLQNFYKQYYVASNMVIAVVGDLSLEKAKQLVKRLTRSLKKGRPAGRLPDVVPIKAGEYRIEFPSTQTHIMTGYLGIKRDDPRYLALKVGNYSLGGGGFQSRLMDEIRDKRGLSYGAYSYFLPMQQTGTFIAALATKNKKLEEALTVSKEVIDKFLKTGPTEKELTLAKKNITGGFPLTIDSNKKLVGTLASIGFYSLPVDYLDTYIDRVNALNRKTVTDALQSVLGSENPVTVIVGAGVDM